MTGVMFLAIVSPCYALPSGGTVAAGQAAIASDATSLTVTQSTDRAILNWQSFDIAQGERVAFQQPSAQAVALNRVTGSQNPSQILGSLSANGTVMLINPNGVVFGPNAQVNVGSLVATTSDIPNNRFMAGNYTFDAPGRPDAAIVNQGQITVADAGLAALVAPSVANSGVITARLGKVHLGSGDAVTVDLYGDGLINLQASAGIGQQLVQNSGVISADGGQVKLTAAAAGSLVNSLINMNGVIEARSVGDKTGEIVISADGSNAVAGNVAANKGVKQGNSTVLVSGVLDASGRNTGEHGGQVTVTGDNVALLSGSVIDASGDIGGGSVHVGGDFHGGGTTPTALNTYVDPNALIVADAVTQGNGGNVAVWADGNTWFYGSIFARGGANGGDGGFAETSGHGYLDAQGYVDLTAMNGNKGTYLLDPTDITIYGNTTSVFDNPGLVAYYALNDGSGTSATDSSGNGNTGTLTNGPTWSSTVAPTPQANSYSLSLDGTNDYVSTSYTSNLDRNMTVSVWFKTSNASSGYPTLVSKSSNGGGDGWLIGFKSNTGQFGITAPSVAAIAYGATNLADGTWHNGVVTISSGATATYTVYIDGTQVAQGTSSSAVDSGYHLTIGADQQGALGYFNGLVDDVRVFNNVLSANDVAELYGSRFTVAGIHDMSQTADVSIQASHNITLDFQGDTLTLASGKSLTLTAGNAISNASAGTITTSQSGGSGGNVSFSAGSGGINLDSTFAINAAGTASLTSAGAMTLGTITAKTITAQTTGATSDLTIASGSVETATAGSGTDITLAAGRNFINDDGSGALVAGGGRWLVYSTNPANDTIGGLSNSFRRFTCAYGGSCPSFPAGGNGFLYSYTPTLTATPTGGISLTYGDAVPNLTGYSYSLSGYLGSDSGSDSVSGSLNGTTTYTQGSHVGSYNVNYSSGSLSSTLGYGFSYANNATAITVGQRPITVTADAESATYGAALGTLTYQITGGSLYGSDTLSGALTTAHGGAGTVLKHANGFDVSGSPFAITQGTLANSDYAITYNPANLTLAAKALTVTADAQSATYGDTLGALTYSTAGLVAGDTLSGALTTANGGAGTVLKHANGFDVSGSPFTITQGTLANSDYTITYNSANLTLSAKTLTDTGFAAANKTYDGTLAATITSDGSLSGVVASDTVNIDNSSASALFDNKNAGTTHVVTASGYSLTGAQSGDYTLTQPSTAASVHISAKSLTVTADAESATYGDTLGALTYSDSGLAAGDSFTGTLTTAHGGAGTVLKHANGFDVSGSPFTITQGTLTVNDGNGGNNYAITYNSANLTLAAKALTDTGFAAANKTYDGTTAATITTDGSLTGVVAGDTVNLDNSSASALFDNRNVGTTHVVTASGYALSGAQAGDYSLTQPSTAANVHISAKALTVTADAQSATYGDTLGALTYSNSGLAAGDSFTGALTTAHGGAGTVLKHANGFDVSGSPFAITQGSLAVNDGNGGNNYTLTYNPANLTLATKTLTAGLTGTVQKVYDGTTAATLSSGNYALPGTIGGDTVSLNNPANGTYDTPNIGSGKTVTVAGLALQGANAGNYTLASATASGPVGEIDAAAAAAAVNALDVGRIVFSPERLKPPVSSLADGDDQPEDGDDASGGTLALDLVPASGSVRHPCHHAVDPEDGNVDCPASESR
jgi:filamentous hemagglutinin family protein